MYRGIEQMTSTMTLAAAASDLNAAGGGAPVVGMTGNGAILSHPTPPLAGLFTHGEIAAREALKEIL
jgi:hypothetical protein